jgi:hypothetical protein
MIRDPKLRILVMNLLLIALVPISGMFTGILLLDLTRPQMSLRVAWLLASLVFLAFLVGMYIVAHFSSKMVDHAFANEVLTEEQLKSIFGSTAIVRRIRRSLGPAILNVSGWVRSILALALGIGLVLLATIGDSEDALKRLVFGWVLITIALLLLFFLAKLEKSIF